MYVKNEKYTSLIQYFPEESLIFVDTLSKYFFLLYIAISDSE